MKKIVSILTLTLIIVGFAFASVANPINDNDKDNDRDGNKMANKSNKQSVFSVVPSPQNEKLSLQFDVNANISSVKMINNQSSVVYQGAKARGASNVMDIPIEDMEPGTYFIRVQTDKGVSVERIIIQ
jgi:hypothetical protein